jgi:L-malate glycosyltransferase
MKRLLYACNTLGTPDHDRCNALSEHFNVLACDWARPNGYAWQLPTLAHYSQKRFQIKPSILSRFMNTAKLILLTARCRPDVFVSYGYHNLAFFGASIIAKTFGAITITLLDSKFDDYSRHIFSDLPKTVLLKPYDLALAASTRAAQYATYLGANVRDLYFCAIDTARVTAESKTANPEFADRPFVMLARFVSKKNHRTALEAYAKYASSVEDPHAFILYGYGELEHEIREMISSSPLLSRHVRMGGALSSADVPKTLGGALALILPSYEEQFGIVATEALAAGIPVIISQNCGACDLISNGQNGFLIDPHNPAQIAAMMRLISTAPLDWQSLHAATEGAAHRADAKTFAAKIAKATEGAR